MKILVCDDIEERGKDTLAEIRRANIRQETSKLIFGGELTDWITSLFKHAKSILVEKPEVKNIVIDSFDFDVVILDNNLADLDISGARHTAESIAGYIRAFTRIPYIVSLNKNPHVDFDLRYLVGDYETRADQALNTEHLSNRELWTGQSKTSADRFLPWYWPALNEMPPKRRGQIDFVKKHFDDSVLTTLSFPEEQIEYLSRHAKGTLSPEIDDSSIKNITFKQFFETSCRSLPIRRERENITYLFDSQDLAVRRLARNIVARVVAAEIDKWIRRDLLGPQDVLVDVPHLLMRMPFLLGNEADKLRQWNAAILSKIRPFGLSRSIYQRHLSRAKFKNDNWVKSPCFWWQMLKSDEKLNDMFFHPKAKWKDGIFCEDTSRFEWAGDDGRNSPIEFAAEFEGAWDRRHVTILQGKRYTPQSRFAL